MHNMKKIDITTTATIRPSLLDDTFSSFRKNMLTDEYKYRLIINIDPIGEDLKRKFVLKVAEKYFDEIICNYPATPGFTKAVIWCWSQTQSDFIFHLEEDWKLLTKINIDYMIEILESNKSLVSLRLNKENTGSSKHSNKFGFIYHPKISLNPTLFKGDFIRNIFPLMEINKNPEKQLRITNKTPVGRYLKDFNHGIYTKDSDQIVVLDIGRNWMDNSKFKKVTGFMEWENK